jgi:hypothetical protein
MVQSKEARARAYQRAGASLFVVAVLLQPASCGSASQAASPVVDGGGGHDSSTAPREGGGSDSAVSAGDTSAASTDGTPTHTSACTPLSAQTGTAINTTFGRLDGTLSYVVAKGGSRSCNGDDSHVHLQVLVNGEVYDVAVDIGATPGDVALFTEDIALPGGAWAEGWHGSDTLTYTALGLHAPQFTGQDPTTLAANLVSELAQANHVSIFGTAYNTNNGCHDVHYHGGGGQDGALFVDPLSPQAHGMFFRFSTDSF